jgi:OFA family oxalate/formate antiporter-like MFS transporter
VVFVLAWIMRASLAGETPSADNVKVAQTKKIFTPGRMLVSPVFWILHVMFALVSASGLMATAQIALVAKNYSLSVMPLIIGTMTLTLALLVDNVMNGGRPLFGCVSDMIGREYTMAIAFTLGGISS